MEDYFDIDEAFEAAFEAIDAVEGYTDNANRNKPQRIGFVGSPGTSLPLTDDWRTMVEIGELAEMLNCSIQEVKERLVIIDQEHANNLSKEKARYV